MYSLPTLGEFSPSHTRVHTRTHTHTPPRVDMALLSAPAGQETRPQQLGATTGLRPWGRSRAPRPSWVAPDLRCGVSGVCVPTLTSTPRSEFSRDAGALSPGGRKLQRASSRDEF